MDSDEEDFVFVGTPIEREEELTSRKKKALAESSGQLRTLVPWKQEVRDEEGRRRFHGAFTGGYSAGYYNTVGSKEGWTPQTFTSSRKNRAEIKRQSITSFLDEDEKAEMESNVLGTSSQFDTFGFTAAEHALKQAKKEQSQRPAIIPGPLPDELVLPAAESIGAKLLLKMGWRHGSSIKDACSNTRYDARREGRKALFAFASDSAAACEGANTANNDFDDLIEEPDTDAAQTSRATPAFLLEPKQDMHGLGYDPYKHAPEFQAKKSGLVASKDDGRRKHFSVRDDIFSSKSGRIAPGFGIGALEELDVEDEDVYRSGYGFEETYAHYVEDHPLSTEDNEQKISGKALDVFPRFRHALRSDHQLERFTPPDIPKDFVPHHKFPAPLVPKNRVTDPPPLEVPPPEDSNLRVMIEGVANLVACCGKLFEDLSREKNRSNPLFSFLSGGSGSEYYAWKLWEQQQKRGGQAKLLPIEKTLSEKQKMSAESRGRILGEKPLERSSKESNVSSSVDNVQIQIPLSDTFTTPVSSELLEVAKPFKDDPAKQERFEQFLKDKYQGGLRSTYSSGASDMSEAARAWERLDFEAAAEVMEKFKRADKNKQSAQELELTMKCVLQFTSGGVEETGKAHHVEELTNTTMYPKREEFTWRPAPLLCKRFDIVDPFMGKAPPAPRMKSKLDTLFFSSETAQSTKVDEEVRPINYSSLPQFKDLGMTAETRDTAVLEVENVERPVDLYKAIFSDDSDDEEVPSNLQNDTKDPQKKIEAASSTFSRLVAGDFLESLGKELGLEVSRDSHPPGGKTDTNSTPIGSMAQPDSVSESHKYETMPSKVSDSLIPDKGRNCSTSYANGDGVNGGKKDDRVKLDDMTMVDDKSKGYLEQHDYESNKPSSSASEDERSRTKSRRRHRSRKSNVASDDSSDQYTDDRHSSRSRSRKRSRERSHHKKKHSSSSSSQKRSRNRSEVDSNRSLGDREKDRSRRKKEKLRRRE